MFTVNYADAVFYQWGVVLVASLIAALTDIRNRRIPNWLTVPLFACGLIHAGVVGGFGELTSSFFAACILMAPYVVLFLFAGGGAGDAKLMAAVGAWLGLSSGIVALVAISICAIIWALLKAASKKRFFTVIKNIQSMIIAFILFVKIKGELGTIIIKKENIEKMALHGLEWQ